MLGSLKRGWIRRNRNPCLKTFDSEGSNMIVQREAGRNLWSVDALSKKFGATNKWKYIFVIVK